MIYEMHILNKYLESIKEGTKKHEYRLGKPERRAIKIGDTIRLITNEDENVTLDVEVTGITLYKSWYEAMKDNWENDFKGLYNSFDELMEDCKNFYTEEEIKKYGIIMFDIISSR
ncbi:MAG: ASCH domain-containing protein [Acholeplasmatales bacterium]|nr:ASCH domain-containing protein [Acholeplasmatales bacterium]